ncbi:hypothetical protein MTP04_02530 [Lysinibacillus sp. PLM2]|nr:hypothetical protein MTP04_02530 [Lysinibacillus sp. PLM2]
MDFEAIREAKEQEARKEFRREYGSMKARIMQPPVYDKKKVKNKRKQQKQSKRANRK